MAEGDTIHGLARRLERELGDRALERAEAPNPRSPVHGRTGQLRGRVLERVEARGKHLLAHLSGGLAIHSHLGISGRWRVAAGGALPAGSWLFLDSGRVAAAQYGGQILRIVPESRLRNDPTLARLGPDLLDDGFTVAAGVAALRAAGREHELGDALLDQTVIAGIGNVYKSESCFAARLSPWRRLADLADPELERVAGEAAALMRAGLESGRRPRDVYRRAGQPCLRCGEPIRSRGQGDANRATYWCPRCQT